MGFPIPDYYGSSASTTFIRVNSLIIPSHLPSFVLWTLIGLVRLPVAVFALAFRKSMLTFWSDCVLPRTQRQRRTCTLQRRMPTGMQSRRHHQHSTC